MKQVKYNNGTTEEKKKASDKKKFEKKWLGKKYYELAPFEINKASLSLKQMRFGTILSHNLKSVTIELDTIKLKSSWTEFILIMLSQLITEQPDTFKETLGKYEVTNTNLSVEKIYGSYSFTAQKYEVFKIYDTGYYLEAILDPRTIFNTIVSLIRILEINPAGLRFNIVAKDKTKEVKDAYSIDEVENKLKEGGHLEYVKIFEKVVEAHRLDVMLLAICNTLYDKYGMTQLLSVQNDEETGLCLNELSTNFPCAKIRNSMLCVYTSGKDESILNFIYNAMDKLNISTKDIKFGFKAENKVAHEWEVD